MPPHPRFEALARSRQQVDKDVRRTPDVGSDAAALRRMLLSFVVSHPHASHRVAAIGLAWRPVHGQDVAKRDGACLMAKQGRGGG